MHILYTNLMYPENPQKTDSPTKPTTTVILHGVAPGSGFDPASMTCRELRATSERGDWEEEVNEGGKVKERREGRGKAR